jgi:RNA polymerase sigma factor for flagellar operon FliA
MKKLPKIEYLELWLKYQSEENPTTKHKLENQLVEIYYPLVRKIAYGVAERIGWKLTPDELSSFGVDGLYIAIRRFDVERGATFSTYAGRRIHGSMVDGMRKEDIIPRSVRINHNKIEKMRNLLESEKGRKVSDIEILEELGIDDDEYIKNKKKFHPVVFSSIEGSDIVGSNTHEDYKQDSNSDIIDNGNISPDSKIVRREFFNKLVGKNFSKMEQKIIYYYYYQDLTMDRISEKLGLSESRISQIHKGVLPRLQDKIERNPKYFGDDICRIIENCNDSDSFF